jgi:hypothetical protein
MKIYSKGYKDLDRFFGGENLTNFWLNYNEFISAFDFTPFSLSFFKSK